MNSCLRGDFGSIGAAAIACSICAANRYLSKNIDVGCSCARHTHNAAVETAPNTSALVNISKRKPTAKPWTTKCNQPAPRRSNFTVRLQAHATQKLRNSAMRAQLRIHQPHWRHCAAQRLKPSTKEHSWLRPQSRKATLTLQLIQSDFK